MKTYYTPEIEEFHVGFEYETIQNLEDPIYDNGKVINKPKTEWVKQEWNAFDNIVETMYENTDKDGEKTYGCNNDAFRVKNLDKEDIESLGFGKPKNYNGHLAYNEFAIYEDKSIIKIKTYWDMLRLKRENLIRVFKGTPHDYPYTEIFRGKIKNKSELRKLLKQLEIIKE